MPKVKPTKRVLKFWVPAKGWRFRSVVCLHCGHRWTEVLIPREYATTDLTCACNQGKPWSPED